MVPISVMGNPALECEINDKRVKAVLAKTGVRRNELIAMDIDDVEWEDLSIKLKPKKKRSNLTVYFDNETAVVLRKWINSREYYPNKDSLEHESIEYLQQQVCILPTNPNNLDPLLEKSHLNLVTVSSREAPIHHNIETWCGFLCSTQDLCTYPKIHQ